MDAMQNAEPTNSVPVVLNAEEEELAQKMANLLRDGQHQQAISMLLDVARKNLPDGHPSKQEPTTRILEGEQVFQISAFERYIEDKSDFLKLLSALVQFSNIVLRTPREIAVFSTTISSYFSDKRPHDMGHFAEYLLERKKAIYGEPQGTLTAVTPAEKSPDRNDIGA